MLHKQEGMLHKQEGTLHKQERISNLMAKEVIISFRRRMDIWSMSKRTREEQKQFKNSLISYYQCAHPNETDLVKCMVLNDYFPRKTVIASHIWKFCTEGEGLREFNLEPSDLNSPRNGLLICESIERAFDEKRLCFLIDRIRSTDLYIKVLDRNLLDPLNSPKVCDGSTKTFLDIDGCMLQCPSNSIPFRRILDFHAKCSFEKAINKGWLEPSSSFVDFFDMSIGSSIPDLHIYQDLFSDADSEEDEDD